MSSPLVVPAGLGRGWLLSCRPFALGVWALVRYLELGSRRRRVGRAGLLGSPWLLAVMLGSVVRLRSGEKARASAREEAAFAALLARVFSGRKVRKTLILRGFFRGLHGAVSKSYRLVVLRLKSRPKTLERE